MLQCRQLQISLNLKLAAIAVSRFACTQSNVQHFQTLQMIEGLQTIVGIALMTQAELPDDKLL